MVAQIDEHALDHAVREPQRQVRPAAGTGDLRLDRREARVDPASVELARDAEDAPLARAGLDDDPPPGHARALAGVGARLERGGRWSSPVLWPVDCGVTSRRETFSQLAGWSAPST